MKYEELVFVELQYYEQQGITLYVNGEVVDPIEASNTFLVHEENTFMRDYIFDEQQGNLQEVRFDRINEEISNHDT